MLSKPKIHYGKNGNKYYYLRTPYYKSLCDAEERLNRGEISYSISKISCKKCLEVLLIKKNDEMAQIVTILDKLTV